MIMLAGFFSIMPMQASDRSSWALCLGAGCAAGAAAAYVTTKFMHGQPLLPLRDVKGLDKEKEEKSVEKGRVQGLVEKVPALDRCIEELATHVRVVETKNKSLDRQLMQQGSDIIALNKAIKDLQRQVLPQSSERKFVEPRSSSVYASELVFEDASEDEDKGVLSQAAAVSAVQEASLPSVSCAQGD